MSDNDAALDTESMRDDDSPFWKTGWKIGFAGKYIACAPTDSVEIDEESLDERVYESYIDDMDDVIQITQNHVSKSVAGNSSLSPLSICLSEYGFSRAYTVQDPSRDGLLEVNLMDKDGDWIRFTVDSGLSGVLNQFDCTGTMKPTRIHYNRERWRLSLADATAF